MGDRDPTCICRPTVASRPHTNADTLHMSTHSECVLVGTGKSEGKGEREVGGERVNAGWNDVDKQFRVLTGGDGSGCADGGNGAGGTR